MYALNRSRASALLPAMALHCSLRGRYSCSTLCSRASAQRSCRALGSARARPRNTRRRFVIEPELTRWCTAAFSVRRPAGGGSGPRTLQRGQRAQAYPTLYWSCTACFCAGYAVDHVPVQAMRLGLVRGQACAKTLQAPGRHPPPTCGRLGPWLAAENKQQPLRHNPCTMQPAS